MLAARIVPSVLAIATLVACAGGGDGPTSTTAFNPTHGPSETEGTGTGTGTGTTSSDDATSVASADATGTPPGNSCCEAVNTPGCSNAETQACVCTLEPSCCQVEWTQDCVSMAIDPCSDPACGTPPGSTGEPTDSGPPPMVTCDELAAQEGWMYWRCEAGGGSQCSGMGTPTTDCTFCCEYCGQLDAVSCGDLATSNGWAMANCEWNGNGACGGAGTPTCDCNFCCEVN